MKKHRDTPIRYKIKQLSGTPIRYKKESWEIRIYRETVAKNSNLEIRKQRDTQMRYKKDSRKSNLMDRT